jgi:hypothetical protein
MYSLLAKFCLDCVSVPLLGSCAQQVVRCSKQEPSNSDTSHDLPGRTVLCSSTRYNHHYRDKMFTHERIVEALFIPADGYSYNVLLYSGGTMLNPGV